MPQADTAEKRSMADHVRYNSASRRDRRGRPEVYRVADSTLDSERALATLTNGDEESAGPGRKLDGVMRAIRHT
jgi:hypothetical protein